ncbi:MAG: MerR family transcriptional regulator [Sphingomonadaceae bacterium]
MSSAGPGGDAAGRKAPGALLTISEVSAELGVPQHILRFWETRFPELRPMKRGGNRRYYRPDDVALCAAFQRLLHEEGYTVKGVKKLLSEVGAKGLVQPASDPVPASPGIAAAVPVAQDAMPAHLLARLAAVRARLASALAAAQPAS